ncbi:MAG: type II toxin-antitoxin system VapC family toxin [Roseiarcus sp.]|jgi:PIN domain nuclease of toxin-antitoxin system|uniref:type II toxin-antitoxin system VapC family toxin n=1 Tax=Roseiarcus sp. TaxID=1969460 RepID=UPI003C26844F
MADPLLLDTCAIIWVANDEPIAKEAQEAITAALLADAPVYVSPISAWEVGMLAARRRISLRMSPDKWFDRLLGAPGLRLAELPPSILIASSFLPGDTPTDPADRIIAATAREYDLRVVTRDRRLLAYAESGYCRALAC